LKIALTYSVMMKKTGKFPLIMNDVTTEIILETRTNILTLSEIREVVT